MAINDKQQAAIDKLDKEMEAAKGNPCKKYMAEQLVQVVTQMPEAAEKIAAEGKTLEGAYNAVVSAARKASTGNCGCLDNETVMKITKEYYDISGELAAESNFQALGSFPGKAPKTNTVSVNFDEYF